MIGARWMSLVLVLLLSVACAPRDEGDFAIPLDDLAVRLTFDGQSARFLFDTGAGAHTFARWFVDAAGMAADGTAEIEALDAVGERVALQVVRGLVGRSEDGRSLAFGAAIVADFPQMFEHEEVGGLLNPQLLARDGQAVVLDLRVPELRFQRFDDAVRRTGARVLAREEFRVCVEADAPVPNLRYAVAVAAHDRTGWLALDTGAGNTSLVSDSRLVAGARLEPGGEVMGVAGRPQAYSVARDLEVSFADFDATIDAQVVETSNGDCGPDGLLGRDALSRCALVFGGNSLAIACT